MNILQSTSAPFLLALIVSALGWYVGQINSDIRNTRVATYELEAGDRLGQGRVLIENVSRSESLENILFALECDGPIDQTKSVQNTGRVIDRPPVAPVSGVMDRRTAGQIAVTATLAPGSVIGLEAELADCSSPLEFYYRPGDSGRFLLLNKYSIDGWMAKNYVKTLPILFLVFLLLFLAWLIISLIYWWRRSYDKPADDNIYTVKLLLGDPGHRPEPDSRHESQSHRKG